MKILLVLSLVFVNVWAEPIHGESEEQPEHPIMIDPPRPPTRRPRHGESDAESYPSIMDDPPRPPATLPTANPKALPRRYTNDGKRLWEGDLVLTQEQVDYLYGPISTRKAIDDVTKRWTDAVVPYTISRSSVKDRQVILSGLQHWMDNSCIRFVEVPEGSQFPHLIFKKLDGCWSDVGMQNKNGQELSIGTDCEYMATVAHEVGHAIGFYHEQSRTDRNKHVKLLEKNINKTQKFNFDIQYNTNNYGVPYDLGSLMHYGLDFFTVNGHNTMVPLDIHRTFDIGQEVALSFYDLKLANIIYSCAADCPSLRCQNEGFVDSTCKCRCKDGFSGPLCQTRVNLPGPICGGDFTSEAIITTPNYPGKVAEGDACVWLFRAPAGQRVNAYFDHFDMSPRYKENNFCIWDYLEVRTDDMDDGDKYCGTELAGFRITSSGNQMALLFKAKYDWHTGLKAVVTFV